MRSEKGRIRGMFRNIGVFYCRLSRVSKFGATEDETGMRVDENREKDAEERLRKD